METTWRALNKGNNRKRYQARSLYSLALAHPFFLASSGEAAFGFFFVTERMRLFSAPHPQLSVITHFELNPTVVEHLASDLIELSTRLNFAHLLATGAVCRGWARSASGNTGAGIARIEEGIGDYRAIG